MRAASARNSGIYDSARLVDQGAGFIDGIGDNRVPVEIALIALLMIFEHGKLNLNLVQLRFFLLVTIEGVAAKYGAFHGLADERRGITGVQGNRNASKSMIISLCEANLRRMFSVFPRRYRCDSDSLNGPAGVLEPVSNPEP